MSTTITVTATQRMSRRSSPDRTTAGQAGALFSAWLFAGWLSPVAADTAETTFTPHIGVSSAWTDNINLAPPGETSNGEIYQLSPGIYLKHESDYLRATLDYEFQQYFYAGGQHGHDT